MGLRGDELSESILRETLNELEFHVKSGRGPFLSLRIESCGAQILAVAKALSIHFFFLDFRDIVGGSEKEASGCTGLLRSCATMMIPMTTFSKDEDGTGPKSPACELPIRRDREEGRRSHLRRRLRSFATTGEYERDREVTFLEFHGADTGVLVYTHVGASTCSRSTTS